MSQTEGFCRRNSFVCCCYVHNVDVYIEGNERISKEDILYACEKNGVAPGRLKDGIDFYKVGESLMIEFNDISWIAVHLDGTAVTVRLVETIPKKDYVEKEEYKDYVADRSGTIVSIAASSGITVVEPGDEVSDGDILISSTVPLKDGETQIGEKKVCADGEVYAERKYELEGISDINYKKRVVTGDTKTAYSVIINENEINIITPSDIDSYALKTDDRIQFRIGDYVIPFSINKKVYEKYNIEKCVRTEEEAQSLADRRLDEELARLLADTGGELSEMHRDILINENNVTIKGYVYIIEKIKKELNMQDLKVIATGGLARVIDPEGTIFDVLDPYLTLKGLRILYEKNAKDKSEF